MSEFPGNFDRGELWLPSEFRANDVVVPPNLNPRNRRSSMDEFAVHFASLALLEQRKNRSPNLQPFRPPIRTGSLDSQSPRYLHNGTGLHFPGTELHHHYPSNPVQLQVGGGGFDETRVSALRRLHSQSQNRNRLLQHGYDIGVTGGNSERISGGTGVFHPRVFNSTTNTISPEINQKPGLRTGQEISGVQQRNSINKSLDLGNECHQHRSDVVLPGEWTY